MTPPRGRRRGLFTLCAWGWALAVSAQTPGVELPPLPSAPRPVNMPALHEMRLANGLRVVVAPRAQLPLVSATLLLLTGPEADPAGRAGLAATTAALLGKGALRAGKPSGATELARQAETLGGPLELASTWHASTIGMTVTVPKLEQALALMADVARRPLLAADELDRVRAQAVGDLRITLNDPSAVASLAARRAFWAQTRYGATPTVASLQRLSRAEARAFHRRWYRPDNAVLVLAGAIDAEAAAKLARSYFGDWPAPASALPVLPAIETRDNDARLVLIDMPGSGQSSVVLVLPFGAISAEQRPLAQVANAVLGLGYSARLNQEVRIRRGLSYGVASVLELHADASLLMAQGQTDHPNAPQVLQLLQAELRRLSAAPPEAEELLARKATLVGDFAGQLDSVATLNALIVSQLAQGRSVQALAQRVDNVMAVSAEQVRDFAASHWSAARQRAVVAGQAGAEGTGAAWRELDPQAQRVPLRLLDLERSPLVRPVR